MGKMGRAVKISDCEDLSAFTALFANLQYPEFRM